jgi:hypothetical protein
MAVSSYQYSQCISIHHPPATTKTPNPQWTDDELAQCHTLAKKQTKKKKHFILKDTNATSIIEKNCLPRRARRRHHLLLLADDHRDAQRFCGFNDLVGFIMLKAVM